MKRLVLSVALVLAGCHEFETVDQEAARRCGVSVDENTRAQEKLMKLPIGSVRKVGRCEMILKRSQVIDFEVENS